MQFLSEKNYHRLFRWGVVGKAIVSIGEIIAGAAFAFLSYDTLQQIAFSIFGGELRESPRDVFWNYFASEAHRFAATPQSVWAFIFLSHGIVKMFLVAGLWRNKLWAYPASAIIFAGFVIYQFYQLTYTPSIALWAITIFDIVLIGLILHEYRSQRRATSLEVQP